MIVFIPVISSHISPCCEVNANKDMRFNFRDKSVENEKKKFELYVMIYSNIQYENDFKYDTRKANAYTIS